MTTSSGVGLVRNGHVLEVTLDRPKANAIDAATSRRLGEVFADFRDDPKLRAAIITGAGHRFFCAGWDLKAAAAPGNTDSEVGVGGFGGLEELPGLNKPVVAALNGLAAGGGFELALSADLIVAAEHVRLALPEVKVGLIPYGGTIKLPRRIPYHVAVDLLLTGRWMAAEEAHRWGIIREIVRAEQLMPKARELANQLASSAPLSISAIKEVIRETEHLPVQQAFDVVNHRGLPAVAAYARSDDRIEGARAFAEKREPEWTGK